MFRKFLNFEASLMRHPNYHHLLYFWAVVREGGIAAAAETLHVTPQTISGQIKRFVHIRLGRRGHQGLSVGMNRIVEEGFDRPFFDHPRRRATPAGTF